MMNHEAEAVRAAPWDFGRGLCGYVWRAAHPRARLLLTHGFAEYVERYVAHYHNLIPRLVALGVDVYGFDMRGHGRSPGARGIVDMRQVVADHHAARGQLAGAGLPLFLFGHSLGGLVAAASAAEDQDRVAGVLLSAPALKINAPLHLRAIAGLAGLFTPDARLAPPLDPEGLSRIPEEVAAYINDPMVSDTRVPAKTGATAIAVSEASWARYGAWTLPVLVLHGLQDRATDPKGSERFIATIRAADKHLELYPEGRHELLNDLDREAAMRVILAWLDGRLARG